VHRVIIIEDNLPLREAFVALLNATDEFRVAGHYSSCEDAIEQLQEDKPAIVLMDLDLPGMSGVEGTKRIRKLYPKTLIMIVTVFEDSAMVFEALCAGAIGYITKNTSTAMLVDAMRELIQGGAPMSIHIAKMVVQSFQKSSTSILSERETEVLTLLSQGKSYKSIGDKLFISRNTIKFHIKNIYNKLEVNTKEEAIQEASKMKYI
jgi:DNA-binding NarL/FixJ family response regulator